VSFRGISEKDSATQVPRRRILRTRVRAPPKPRVAEPRENSGICLCEAEAAAVWDVDPQGNPARRAALRPLPTPPCSEQLAPQLLSGAGPRRGRRAPASESVRRPRGPAGRRGLPGVGAPERGRRGDAAGGTRSAIRLLLASAGAFGAPISDNGSHLFSKASVSRQTTARQSGKNIATALVGEAIRAQPWVFRGTDNLCWSVECGANHCAGTGSN